MAVAGFDKHPENINREGRPKKKTIVEMVEDYMKNNPEFAFEQLNAVIVSMMRKKDKEMIKEFWHQRDGMPKQQTDVKVEGDIAIVLQTKKDEK